MDLRRLDFDTRSVELDLLNLEFDVWNGVVDLLNVASDLRNPVFDLQSVVLDPPSLVFEAPNPDLDLRNLELDLLGVVLDLRRLGRAGANIGGSLMETSGFPLFDLGLAGSRSTVGFAHPAGFGGAKRCFAKPRLRPGGRPTSLRRQRSRQERRPRFTGHPLRGCPPALLASGGRRRTRPLLCCSAAQKGLSADTEPLLRRHVCAASGKTQRSLPSARCFSPFSF